MPKLSICIPTHHGRADQLRTAILSVIEQVPDGVVDRVELCVSDNASGDGTTELVAQLSASTPVAISYRRWDRDLGPPRNLLASVAMANGDWCWLLGSDDALAPGGIARVLELIGGYPDAAGITVYRDSYDSKLAAPLGFEPHPGFFPELSGVTTLHGPSETFDRLGLALTFQSANIARREIWMRAISRIGPDPVDRYPWVTHVAIFGQMLAINPLWVACPEPLVWQRTGNAELGPLGGSVMRFFLEVTTDLTRVWARVPNLDTRTRRKLRERWRQDVASPAAIARIRAIEGHTRTDDLRLTLGYARSFGTLPAFWLQSVPAVLKPKP